MAKNTTKKGSRISVNTLESTAIANVMQIPFDSCPGVEIEVKTTLSLQEMLQFVEDVVSSCVDKATGKYIPEIKMFSVKIGLLTMYANFNLPSNVGKQYELIYNTSAISQVLGVINPVQYDEILAAIDSRIEHELALMNSAVSSKVNELTHQMNDAAQKIESAFSGVTADEINALMKNISAMDNIDEEKLAKAVLSEQKNNSGTAVENSKAVDSGEDDNVIVFPKK